MKKLMTWILLLAMCVSLFAGCKSTPSNVPTGNETPDTTTTVGVDDPVDEVDPADLAAAIEYVKTIYKKTAEITAKDFQRIGTVPMGDIKFEVVWTVDVSEDLVKIVKEDNGMVTIDVNEECEKETPYVLTATITDAAGNSASHSWNHKLPGALDMDFTEIVNAAYALANGESLPYEATLTGMITSIDTPWSADYKNITVTISIEGCPGKPIMCYRLKGDGADTLAVGDTITVTGTLKNYNGTIEFDAGCTLDELVKGDGVTPEAPDDPLQIIDEAYALANGEALLYNATLTGVITSIDTPWSDQYGNITVTIVVSGRESKPIQCFRLKGDGAANLVKGDTVTVTGQLKNYNGTIEFNAGCTLDKVDKTGGPAPELPSDRSPQAIVDALYNLGANESLPSCSLTGVITKIDTPWSDQYNNISVTIVIENRESKPVLCYRLKGDGASGLAVGDTITVTGILTNYVGSLGIPTYEFTSGCVVSNIVKGEGGTVTPEEPDKPVVDIPSSLRGSISNGDKVVIYAPAYGKALSANKVDENSYYNRGVDVYADGDKLVGYGDAEIWTVTKNADGSYSFSNGGQKIGLGEQFSSMNLGAVYADWKVSSLGDGLYLIQNVGRENYIEWYSSKDNWSTYNSSSAATDDQFQMAFYLVEDDTTEEPDIPTEPETPEEPEDPEVPDEPVTPTTPEEIVDAAYALEKGASLEGTYTLTGVITSVDTPYSEQYKNVTVTIQVGNMTDKPIQCYRLKGDGADVITVGDMITVTGKLKNYNGTVEFDAGCTLDSYMTPAQIVEAAYALEKGASLEGTYTLTGVITSVDTPYSEQYKNVTVTIQVGDLSDKLIMCYRLVGEGADTLAVGDTITVTGKLKNYNGTVEFDAKCSLDKVVKGDAVAPEAPEDPAEIVKEAYELEVGAALPYEATLTGVITEVNTKYSESFKNVTVTIQVGDLEEMPIVCFRLKGEGADVIDVGDTITVTGSIKNYNGTVEFDSGCMLDSYEKASDEEDPTEPSEPEDPTVPSEPENPTEPSEPEDTTVPSEPEDTTVPSEPEDTTVPSEPEDTTVPSEPEDTTVPSEPEDTTVPSEPEDTTVPSEPEDTTVPSEPEDTTVPSEPAELPIKDGDEVVIYAPAYNKALSAEKVNETSFYNKGVDVSFESEKLTGYGDAEIWTVTKNADGSYSFSNGGQNIGLADSFSSMNLGAVNDDWTIISLDGGLYLIQNVVRGNYIEWYASKDNWSTYNSSSAATDDQFQLSFYIVEVEEEEPSDPTETDPIETDPVETDPVETDPVETDPVETDPVETDPTETDPTETDPVETDPVETDPAEPEGTDPVLSTPEEIVDAAYALEKGASLEGTYTLTGVITSVDTPYNAGYKNVTVTIQVGNMTDKPIQCFRLKGEGTDVIAVGDMITVTGILKNYNGTIEFDAGCILVSYMTPAQIVEAAYALEKGASLEGTYTLTGVITSVDTPYSEQFKNVTVTIQVGDLSEKLIQCFRLKGEGADLITVGDTITVTGYIKNYNGTIEFDAGCSLDAYEKAPVVEEPTEPTDPTDPTEPDEPAGLPIKDGGQVVIYAPAYGKALSTVKTGFYNVGVDVVINDGILTGYAETEIWTVVDNRDGTFSFANGEQNIGLADSYSSLDLGAVNDDWRIVDLGDGLCLIQNVVRGNYIEWYASKNNWSSYNSSSAATDDQFQLSFYVIN